MEETNIWGRIETIELVGFGSSAGMPKIFVEDSGSSENESTKWLS